MKSQFAINSPRLCGPLAFLGVIFGGVFYCASLTPSLIPRTSIVQGIESGFALAVGYGIGVLIAWTWWILELPVPSEKWSRVGKRFLITALVLLVLLTSWRATVWENSIRNLMEMPPVKGVYAPYLGAISIICALMLVALGRIFLLGCLHIDRRLKRWLPRRYSYIGGTVIVIFAFFSFTTKLLIKPTLRVADQAFLELNGIVDEGIERPDNPMSSGSPDSLIEWDMISRRGKEFVVSGPSKEEIEAFTGRESLSPLRVYVGMGSGETPEQRAELALRELIRIGGFERSVLVVANPTGTGWLQPEAVHPLEYLHGGDTAIVTTQYSYLPSWLTLLVDPDASRYSAHALFDQVYDHWKTLPRNSRPKLYLHGLSLGAFGSETCADLFTLFEDPIDGAVWSGPPFPSTRWAAITRARNEGSPVWLPTFRDERLVRFTALENALDTAKDGWGPMRFVYIQHASDPMTFFAPEILYRRPEWLNGKRGPDVSPYMSWYPVITFLQVGFDLPMATSVPAGYGHNIAADSYIDAWIAVTAPDPWDEHDTERLKELYALAKEDA